jgi:hypothetical protein
MMSNGDTDPANTCLLYIANRFDITLEQRYWLCFLYSTCYCGPTAYYMFNEFPDYELIDLGRMQRWWKKNKQNLIFTTDRAWIRSRDQFVEIIRSYQEIVGKSQVLKYEQLMGCNKSETYNNCFQEFSKVYQMGRFSLFIYLDVIHHVTGYPIEPDGIDLRYAESSRNGLCYAIDREDLITHKGNKKLTEKEFKLLQDQFVEIYQEVKKQRPWDTNVWALETSMCAFKKYKKNNKRWVGYYIERQKKEISKMQSQVTEGVNWLVLWQYRDEYFPQNMLSEKANYELF